MSDATRVRRRRTLMAFGVAALTIGLLGAFQAQPIAGDLAASSEGARTDDLPEVMDAETDASASARADRTSDGADRDAEPSSSAFEDGFAGATTSGTETARPPVIAEVDGLALRLPTWSPEVVGFHEASSPAQGLEPAGRLVENHNSTRIDPPPDVEHGAEYLILSSRGRIHPPTSAIDIVMRDDEPVLAPVSGVVADVRAYELYGRYDDHRIEIHPDDAPHLRVVLVHVDEVQVVEGERVEVGRSILARTANRFDFSSQIDRETHPERWPHVHVEVQDRDAPRPGDEPLSDASADH